MLLAIPCVAEVYISECMADNDNTLQDIDGDFSDWIELYNNSSNAVNLAGWYLTDTTTNLTKWTLPAVTIPGKGFLVVFASDKDRAVSGAELHTNFKLSASGETVALVQPDGTTVENQISFPEQQEDISYGYGFSGGTSTSTTTLVESGAPCTAHIPSSAGDSNDWKLPGFDDSGWLSGTTGVGFERSSGYEFLIGLDVGAMHGVNASVYMRVPFIYDSSNPADLLRLGMQFDDGFVAYINSTWVASYNAPMTPAWNSASTDLHDDAAARSFIWFDLSAYEGALQDGANVLSIHGLNETSTSSDLLFVPKLQTGFITSTESRIELAGTGLLEASTPGGPNAAVTYLGYCDTPTLGPERGFYDAPFQVSITNISEGATIRYTTDGSAPTELNGTVYTGPVTIDGTTLLRAAAVRPGYQPSVPNTQTYLFIDDVLKQDGNGLPPYADWGDGGPDWEVDPSMTNAVITDFDGETFTLADALLDVPTVSLVTDWDNWWSDEPGPPLATGLVPWQGIYADMIAQHADRRPVSMEFFTADGSETFAENGRVSVIGGGIGGTSASRWKSDKLSMRVAFDGKLNYPVFGDDAAQKFNGLVLDAHLAWCWTHAGRPYIGATPKFVSDALSSDIQNSMGNGKGAPHSRFVHLYLNGLYWGMFDMHERPDEHFAAEYYGGANEDYDSIKHLYDDTSEADSDYDGLPFNDNITGGDDANLHAMFALARADLSQQSNYETLEQMLDIDDLIDYLLMNFYLGNTDWAHKNWYATFNRNDPDGRWRYHSWDAEHIIETSLFDADLAGALAYDSTVKNNTGGPTEIHQNLTAGSAEYRLRFADQIHRHFFNDGILTIDNVIAAFWSRVKEVDRAMLGEAARWADNKAYLGYGDYDYSNWFNHMLDLRDNYFPYRYDVVLNQLKAAGLYPDTAAPEFTVNGSPLHGGLVAPTDAVGIESEYAIYYTTDGTDPRAVGGAVAGSIYSAPLSFSQPTLLKARAKNGNEWSALCEAVFWTDDIPLAVTELMYHAPDGNAQDYIEIRNTSSETVSLYGYKLDSAIDFQFRDSAIPSLDPGAFLLAIKDVDQFSSQYSTNGILIAGEYNGDFDNNGEKVDLEFWNEDLISFRYSDARNWPQAADGAGHSLVPLTSAMDDEARGSLDYGGNWRASSYIGGSPGYADPVPQTTVLLNEITAHTDTGEDPPFESNDQIELYNPTAADQTLNGWYLSDDLDELQKWAIPDGTVVPAHGFLLFDEDDFHSDRIAGFGLNKAGEVVVLSTADRVVDSVRFKGQLNGVSLGRYPDGADSWVMTLPTPEAPNDLLDYLWISELMYNPPAPSGYANGDIVEYIQIENRVGYAIPFESSEGPFRIDGGVSYTFPSGFSLLAGEKLWLVSFDPSDATLLNLFCSTYGLNAAEEIILGPYKGHLSNGGERVAIEWLQASDDPFQPLETSWAVLDELYYFNQSPWPEEADGTGYPLVRRAMTSWGVPTPSDSDADGLDDAWETLYFGSLLQDETEDLDNDRFNNLQESICGTNPTNGLSYFAIDCIDAPSIQWVAAPGRSYSVYWTDDLAQPFIRIASGLSAGLYTDPLHSTNGCNYYYITAEME
ncbi:lamin tail domain-containing protein [Pontiellaceae bacterium B1224]|nr:lamin tail domain-containing protein [Pontiellaceae bacterium B1224]